jgi:hypothetical protein
VDWDKKSLTGMHTRQASLTFMYKRMPISDRVKLVNIMVYSSYRFLKKSATIK